MDFKTMRIPSVVPSIKRLLQTRKNHQKKENEEEGEDMMEDEEEKEREIVDDEDDSAPEEAGVHEEDFVPFSFVSKSMEREQNFQKGLKKKREKQQRQQQQQKKKGDDHAKYSSQDIIVHNLELSEQGKLSVDAEMAYMNARRTWGVACFTYYCPACELMRPWFYDPLLWTEEETSRIKEESREELVEKQLECCSRCMHAYGKGLEKEIALEPTLITTTAPTWKKSETNGKKENEKGEEEEINTQQKESGAEKEATNGSNHHIHFLYSSSSDEEDDNKNEEEEDGDDYDEEDGKGVEERNGESKEETTDDADFEEEQQQQEENDDNNKSGETKRKRKKRRRSKCKVPMELRGWGEKYWRKRGVLFSKFDEDIQIDRDGWFSITPEGLAWHQAERLACSVIVDAFAGCGGNAIQFAFSCHHVIAVEINPVRLEMAKHNARVYGVEDRIEFILGDFLDVAPYLKADIVFLSPPWGGPGYSDLEEFDVEKHMIPRVSTLLRAIENVTSKSAWFLPKNTRGEQLLAISGGQRCEIEQMYLIGRLKGLTLYCGDFADQKVEENDEFIEEESS